MAKLTLDPRILFLQGALGIPLSHLSVKPPIAPAPPAREPPPGRPSTVSPPDPAPAPLPPDAVALAPSVPGAVKPKRAKAKDPGKPRASKNARRLQAQDDGWGAPRRPVVLPLLTSVPAPAAPAREGGIQLTDEQQAIVAAARDLAPGQCMRVVAYAGAGKTSTMRLVAQARSEERALYLAFNRGHAKERAGKHGSGVSC